MSRTKRGAPKRFQNHEEGWARKLSRRLYRTIVKRFMKQGKYDDIPPKKGTQGWMSW